MAVKYLRALSLLLMLFCSSPPWAVQPDEMLADPALEARARALSRELRCMVCQNQSIDDSEAPLAHDLRVLVRERLKAGDSDTQVLDFMVARYGEFVFQRARMILHTDILWAAPLTILVIVFLAISFSLLRRSARSPMPECATLSEAEQIRLSAI